MNHIRCSRYAEATHAAVAHARAVPTKNKAQALLSLAKLTSILATTEGSAPKAKSLSFIDKAHDTTPSALHLRLTNAASVSTPQRGGTAQQKEEQDMGSTVAELRSNLAVLKAQELLQEVCSAEFRDPSLRLNVESMVGLVVRIVESQQDSTQSELSLDRPLDQSDLVRYFGVGLSLLSMELDVVEAIAADSERDKQLARLESMLQALWGAVVKVQTDAWLQLSACPDLSSVEEEMMRSGTVLYGALFQSLLQVAQNNISDALMLHNSEDRLHSIIAHTGVDRLCFNRDGELQVIPEDKPRNERVVFVIKICVDLAVRAAQAAREED